MSISQGIRIHSFFQPESRNTSRKLEKEYFYFLRLPIFIWSESIYGLEYDYILFFAIEYEYIYLFGDVDISLFFFIFFLNINTLLASACPFIDCEGNTGYQSSIFIMLRMYCINTEASVFMFNGGSSYGFTIHPIFTRICMRYLHY